MTENGAQEKPLTVAQHRAIASLLVSKNIRAASEHSEIAERTLWRWLADPRFLAALHSAEGGVVADVVRRLLQLSDKALDTLERVLDSETASQHLKLRAAALVLDQLLTLRELQNTESRLAALEAALYAKE